MVVNDHGNCLLKSSNTIYDFVQFQVDIIWAKSQLCTIVPKPKTKLYNMYYTALHKIHVVLL